MKYLRIENLTKKYKDKIIFNNLSFTLSSNKVYFLTSENGSGKTTFLKCILDEISYIGSIDKKDLRIIFMPEKPLLSEDLSLNTFLKMFYLYSHKNYDEELFRYYYQLFKIDRYKTNKIKTLSKGTKQKIMIIKTITEEADVYLFDEPLNGLDSTSRLIFMKEIYNLSLNDKIIIIATHYYDDYNFDNKEVINLHEVSKNS